MILRGAVDQNPQGTDRDSDRSRHGERRRPAETPRDPRYEQRSDDDAQVAASIEYARRQRPLLSGEPFADRLDGGGEIASLGKAQPAAYDREARHRPHQ